MSECRECNPILCYDCDQPIYESDPEYLCDDHADTEGDGDYCVCDDEGCGICNYSPCACDTIYDNYRDSLLERDDYNE